MIYSYRREVRSCSFRQHGQFSGALNRGASDGWASRSLFVCVIFFFLNFDAGVPSYKYIHYDEESIVSVCNAYMHLCKL